MRAGPHPGSDRRIGGSSTQLEVDGEDADAHEDAAVAFLDTRVEEGDGKQRRERRLAHGSLGAR